MNITICCIGKIDKKSPENELIERYIARLPWNIDIKEYVIKKNLTGESLKDAEADLLLSSVAKNSKIIVLDETGKKPPTNLFAEQIKNWQDQGISNLTFLIGGAAGHGAEVLKSGDYILSLGAMTWPHMLVRPMLIEQLYRVHTIFTGHPYHK